MTQVNWLIDADMFDAYRDELVAAIRRQQQIVKLIRPPSPPYRWGDAGCGYRETFPADACVVALGDIELATRIHREHLWRPGVFASVEHFACSSYYRHFGEYLLNGRYIMLPFGELRRCREFLFDTLGHEGRIFVRPDSPLKLFTGQCMSAQTFEVDLEFMGFYDFSRESLVVVSSPRAIDAEWRFVIADKSVVAGSQYKLAGNNDIQPGFDREAHQLACRIAASGYEPDPVWVLDICRTSDGAYHLLEIGGFSFADLYACDKDAIVSAVSPIALREWGKSREN
jgi:hypothetical protein